MKQAGDGLDIQPPHLRHSRIEDFQSSGLRSAFPQQPVPKLLQPELPKQTEIVKPAIMAAPRHLIEPDVAHAIDGALHSTPELNARRMHTGPRPPIRCRQTSKPHTTERGTVYARPCPACRRERR